MTDYPDLSQPQAQQQVYPDLSQPTDKMASVSGNFDDYIKSINQFVNSQPPPEKKSFFKELSDFVVPPEARHGIDTIFNTALAMEGGKLLYSAPSAIMKGVRYLQPQKAANQFMNELGQGKTSEENISDLAKRLSFSRNSAAEEALQHKRPVFNALGEKQITDLPESQSYLFNPKSFKDYSGDLKEMHETFYNNPTLNNADALQQQLGGRIGKLRKLQFEGKLDRSGDDELFGLAKSRNNLINDMDNFMSKQDPVNKAQYDLFRSKWKNNVTPYDDSPILSEIVRKGNTEGITPGEIKNIFSYPSAKIKKVISDIGPSGQKNILYNELQSETPIAPPDLADALKKSKQFGYQQYIDPQMELLAQKLPKQYKTSEILKTVGKGSAGAAGGFLFGHPVIGAMLGIGSKPAVNVTKKILEKMNK